MQKKKIEMKGKKEGKGEKYEKGEKHMKEMYGSMKKGKK